jgi:peptide/nickel transport system substrate-binding protein
VQKGISASEKGAAFLREAFARVGVRMDVVALDLAAVMGRWAQGDYDAMYHFFGFTDTDPGGNMDFWLSSGSMHLWHPRQATPATDWEARVDALMRQQAAALELSERQRLFAEVQQTLADHLPALTFARQHVYLGTSPRITGARPAVQRPQLLWDIDQMSVTGS